MTKQKKVDKFVFTLTDINVEQIHHKYDIIFDTNLSFQSVETVNNTTKIEDLLENRNYPTIMSFLDESKHSHKCNISTSIPSVIGIYNCFWCKNPFDTQPIGCPVNYIPKKAIKTYFSEISKDIYTIKENISSDRTDFISKDIILTNKDTYETDGVLCSWNCMAAFIIENKKNPFYSKSPVLMYKMYKDITGQDPPEKIIPAPHWRCLKEYGGFKTIKEFRDGFNKLSYEYHGIVKNISSPISYLYEEHVRL